MRLPELTPPPDRPVADARVRAVSLRVAVAVLGVLLTLAVYGTDGWLAVGIPFSVLAAWVPEYLLGWALIVFLALGELDRSPGLSWRLLVLLAGVHLLHLLGMLTLGLPWRSWVQPRVLLRLVRRFVAIQIPVQLTAVVLLLLLAPDAHGHRPITAAVFTVVGLTALSGLALLLLRTPSDGS